MTQLSIERESAKQLATQNPTSYFSTTVDFIAEILTDDLAPPILTARHLASGKPGEHPLLHIRSSIPPVLIDNSQEGKHV